MDFNKLILNFIIVFLSIVASSYAQEKEGDYILSKVSEYYQTKGDYVLDLQYKMYRGYNKDSLTENYKVRIKKSGLRLKMSFLDYDLQVFKDLQLTISDKLKVIYINDITQNFNPSNLSQYAKAMTQFYEVTHSEKKGKKAVISMIPKVNNVNPYNKINLKIDTSNYSIVEQDLFFSKQIPFTDFRGNINLHNACLNISFKESQKKESSNLNSLDYFMDYSNNKKIILSSNFSEFELIDQRKNK